jgi:hypothetical protein
MCKKNKITILWRLKDLGQKNSIITPLSENGGTRNGYWHDEVDVSLSDVFLQKITK